MNQLALESLRAWLDRVFIDAEGARLRREDEKKSRELQGFLTEAAQLLGRVGRRQKPLTIVDAAAGKGYVGLAIASLVGPQLGRELHVTFIEREEKRAADIARAAAVLGIPSAHVEVICGDVGELRHWPAAPTLAVALHACGDATDKALAAATSQGAQWILTAPCCVASWLPAVARASAIADTMGLPPLAEIRRRHVEAHVLAERTLGLEAEGWETRAVAFVPPTVTPYNVALRAQRVRQAQRMANAARKLQTLREPFAV